MTRARMWSSIATVIEARRTSANPPHPTSGAGFWSESRPIRRSLRSGTCLVTSGVSTIAASRSALAFDQIQRGTVAQIMTPDALVLMSHTVCRPYALKARQHGRVVEVDTRLPRPFAVMYLDWRGEWRLLR